MDQGNLTLRGLYQLAELPGKSPLKDAQADLDSAVRSAYGMSATQDVLAFLLELNLHASSLEQKMQPVQAPGIPSGIKGVEELISADRMEMQPRTSSKGQGKKPFVMSRDKTT